LAAVTTADLSTLMTALDMGNQADLDFAGTPPPVSLDRFDRDGWNFWYLPWQTPAGQTDTYDYESDFTYAHAQGVGLQYHYIIPSGSDTAAGMVDLATMAWAPELARQVGVPSFIQLITNNRGGLWLANRYPNLMAQRMPQFVGEEYSAGAYMGGQPGYLSWAPNEAKDVQLAMIEGLARRYATDDNITGYMEPHCELKHAPHDIMLDFGPDADVQYRQFLADRYQTPAAVDTRWQTGGAITKWAHVHIPELRSFFGWGSSAVDLQGDWKCGYEDTIPPGDLTDWYQAALNDTAWPAVTAPGHDRTLVLPKKAAVFRRAFTLTPSQYTAVLQSGHAYLYVWDLNYGGTTATRAVALNGTILTTPALPINNVEDWVCVEVTAQLVNGANILALRLPQGFLGYSVYLSTSAPTRYPNLSSGLNAQWADFNDFIAWTRGQSVKRGIEAIRRGDPEKYIKLAAPDAYVDQIKPLAEMYGGAFHNTGSMAGFWTDYLPSTMRSSGLPMTAEPGGAAPTLPDLKRYIGLWATEGVTVVDYFRHLGDITWQPELKAWFDANQPLIHQFGKYHMATGRVAVLHSARAGRLLGWPWDVNSIDNFTCSPYWWPVEQYLPYPRDAVEEGDFANGNVNQYDVIIDANTTVMSPTLVNQIQAWVTAGGTFITFVQTGRYTPEGGAWPIASLTGYNVLWVDGQNPDGTSARWQNVTRVPGQTVLTSTWWNTPRSANGMGLSRVDPNCQNVLSWPNGDIAMGVRPLGAGRVVSLGMKFCNNRLWYGGTDSFTTLMNDLMAWCGKPTGKASANLCTVTPFVSNNGLFDCYIMWAGSATTPTTTTLYVPGSGAPTAMRDISTGATVTGTPDVPNNRVDFTGLSVDQNLTREFIAPRNQLSVAPLEWFTLQRKWWKGTTAPAAAPPIANPAGNNIDLSQDWAFAPATDPTNMVLPSYDDRGWSHLDLGIWSYSGFPDTTSGVFRKWVTIPSAWSGAGKIWGWLNGATAITLRPNYDAKVYVDGTLVYNSALWKYGHMVSDLTTQLTPGEHLVAILVNCNQTSPPYGLIGGAWVEFIPDPVTRQNLSGSWEPSTNGLTRGTPVTFPGTTTTMMLRRTFTPDS
ncbi:MAG TPA: hypothetical protein VGL77_05145, partial [Armatimonadota bacterium]